MTKFISFLSCFFIVASLAAQEIHYEYIKVPEKYEFQKAENQYQLNALTAFLFEKYGFKALYKNGMPAGVKPCDVLTANVHDDSNLFRTKLYVTLTDCENRVVFTTETGSSREKAFKPSQHEALRNAFASFENVEITSKVSEKLASGNNNNEKELPEEIVVDPIVTSEEIENVAVEEISSEAEITPSEAERNLSEAGKIQKFTNGPVTYLLRNTTAGYELFREGEQQKFASLMKSGGGDNFLYSSKNVSGNAFFDRQGNLVVEYLDPNTQQLISVIYKVQAQ